MAQHYISISKPINMKKNESDGRSTGIQSDPEATKAAAINAAKDMAEDPDLDQRHKNSNDDLDEGALARLGNDRNDLA
jgi:hypothetical protein